jgi:uncharacterized membrane protein YbhN (UPF0104 family)
MPAAQAMTVDAPGADPLAALVRAPGRAQLLRRVAPAAAVLVAGVLVAVFAPGVARVFADALDRALDADPRWVLAAVGFELLSFAGYIVLFWHIAGRAAPRVGLRASAEVSLAGTAVTRLLPTAGAGGAALTWWSLRRAGQDGEAATRTLLTFLVVLYSVFLGSLLVSGTLLAAGVVPGDVALQLAAVPAAAAGAGVALALALAMRHRRRAHDAPAAAPGRIRRAGHALGAGVHDAFAVVARPHPRLLGAPAWWGFDMLVLFATFSALGEHPPIAVLIFGYFLGQVANTIPLPGAASGGMAGAFIALGLAPAVVLPAVLAYRAIAIWTPVPIGAAAFGGLRRTFRRWAEEDSAETAPAPLPAKSRPAAAAVPPCSPGRSRRPARAGARALRRRTRTPQPSWPRCRPPPLPAPSLSAARSGFP